MTKNKINIDSLRIQKEMEFVKRELEELRVRLERTEKADLSKLPLEAAKKVGETATEVMKTASAMVDKAVRVAQTAANGVNEKSEDDIDTDLEN